MNINRGKALKKAHYSGFLTRLAKNQAGNVMPLLGFLVFPMAAMVGGAVDLSRIYMVQTRLQNACDAGAIAARRGMVGASPSNDDKTMGNQYFDANFPAGSFGATSVTRSYSGTDNKVVGTATAVVPATVMQIFGREDFSVDASCTAVLSVPIADVMFDLDLSGSMSERPPGDAVDVPLQDQGRPGVRLGRAGAGAGASAPSQPLAAVAGVQEEFLQHSPEEFFQTSPAELRQLLISCATAVVARATVATNIAN